MIAVQLLRRGTQAVAVFGDGQADDPNGDDRSSSTAPPSSRRAKSTVIATDYGRGFLVPLFSTNVYSPSCAASTSRIGRSPGNSPAPTMPHSRAVDSTSRRSCAKRAMCARWNPPKPRWTMPGTTDAGSYDGTRMWRGSSRNVARDRRIGFIRRTPISRNRRARLDCATSIRSRPTDRAAPKASASA